MAYNNNYNSDPTPLTLAGALTMDGELRQNAVSRYFEQQSGQFNALKRFTSVFDPKTQGGGGPRSIFCEKTDLTKGGAQRVVFNTIGIPGGPGVSGADELTGKTSKSLMGTYPVIVDWVRDAFELTEDEVEMLAAGRSIEQTSIDLLAEKMGLVKQNQMLKRLIDDADGNVIRPNNRATTDALLAGDVLELDLTTEARARLQTMGAKPLMRNLSKTGCPVDKYLIFADANSMLNIRNDSDFQSAISQGDVRGDSNANFSGEILSWQGNPFYEFPTTDQDWDDFLGGPLVAKARIGVLATTDSTRNGTAGATPKLVVNANNTNSQYFQWFNGMQYGYNRIENESPATLSGNTYYAWVCNPDGSRAFVSYAGQNVIGNANQITIKNILAPTAGTSSKGATQVGNLNVGSTAAYSGSPSDTAVGYLGAFTVGGSGATLPTTAASGFVYTSDIRPGAILLQANANGALITRSFAFGSMSACFAHGRIRMTPIKQERDYEFIHGRGFKMIFGTGVCKNAQKKPVGYMLIEHAVTIPGYPVPVKL